MTTPSQPHELVGRLVRLEPLRPSHAPALFPSASDPEVWRWKLVPRPQSTEELATMIDERLIGPGRWPFVVSSLDGRPIGSTTLANFDWTHGSVEMGFTWLERTRWGQGYNEDSKRLLLRHSFENIGMHRIEWQVDDKNVRSIAALKRLGFRFEGTHRSRHVRPDGTRRDSLYFSLFAEEWPACEPHLEALIAERATERTGSGE